MNNFKEYTTNTKVNTKDEPTLNKDKMCKFKFGYENVAEVNLNKPIKNNFKNLFAQNRTKKLFDLNTKPFNTNSKLIFGNFKSQDNFNLKIDKLPLNQESNFVQGNCQVNMKSNLGTDQITFEKNRNFLKNVNMKQSNKVNCHVLKPSIPQPNPLDGSNFSVNNVENKLTKNVFKDSNFEKNEFKRLHFGSKYVNTSTSIPYKTNQENEPRNISKKRPIFNFNKIQNKLQPNLPNKYKKMENQLFDTHLKPFHFDENTNNDVKAIEHDSKNKPKTPSTFNFGKNNVNTELGNNKMPDFDFSRIDSNKINLKNKDYCEKRNNFGESVVKFGIKDETENENFECNDNEPLSRFKGDAMSWKFDFDVDSKVNSVVGPKNIIEKKLDNDSKVLNNLQKYVSFNSKKGDCFNFKKKLKHENVNEKINNVKKEKMKFHDIFSGPSKVNPNHHLQVDNDINMESEKIEISDFSDSDQIVDPKLSDSEILNPEFYKNESSNVIDELIEFKDLLLCSRNDHSSISKQLKPEDSCKALKVNLLYFKESNLTFGQNSVLICEIVSKFNNIIELRKIFFQFGQILKIFHFKSCRCAVLVFDSKSTISAVVSSFDVIYIRTGMKVIHFSTGYLCLVKDYSVSVKHLLSAFSPLQFCIIFCENLNDLIIFIQDNIEKSKLNKFLNLTTFYCSGKVSNLFNHFKYIKMENVNKIIKNDVFNLLQFEINSRDTTVESHLNTLKITKFSNISEKITAFEMYDYIVKFYMSQTKHKYLSGTCQYMCPTGEYYRRKNNENISIYESSERFMAIKEYTRSSADQELPLPHELRPPSVLAKTIIYIVKNVVNSGKYASLDKWYNFIWTRTRAIRKDINHLNLKDEYAIYCLEIITRFHIFCIHYMIDVDDTAFDKSMNDTAFKQSMVSLLEIYNHHRNNNTDIISCNEPEFRAYNCLYFCDSHCLVNLEDLPERIYFSRQVQTALSIVHSVNNGNFVKFFNHLDKLDILSSCLLVRKLQEIRYNTLKRIVSAYTLKSAFLKVSFNELIRWLGFTDREELQEYLTPFEPIYADNEYYQVWIEAKAIADNQPTFYSSSTSNVKKSNVIQRKFVNIDISHIISGVYNNCRNWINQNDNFFNAEREPFIDDDFNFSMFDILPVESMDVFSNYMDRVKRDKKNESYESCQNINFSYNDTVQSEFDRQKLYGEPSVMIDFASDNNVHVLPSVKYVYDKLVDSLTRSVCQEYGLKSNFENTVCNVNVSEIVLGMYLNEYCGILLKPILTEFCNMNRITHSATNMILDSFLERFIRENEKVIDCVRVNPILKVDNVNNCKFENETNLKSGIKCKFKNISDSPVEKKQTKKIVKSKYNTLYIRKCYRKHVLERYWYKWRFVISFKKFLIHLSLTRPLFLDFISNDSFILIKNAAKNFYKHFDDAIFTNLILYEIQKTKTDNSQSTCNFYSTLSISSCLMKVVDTDDQGVFIWTVHIHILNDSSALQIWIRCKIESEFYNMQHVQFKINNKYFIKFQYENFDTISQNIGPFDLHLLILDHVKYLPEKITKESHVLFFKNDSNLDILCKDLYKLERDKLNFTVINCNNDAHLCLETSLVKLFQVAYQNSSPLYEICFFSFMQHITLEFIKYPISECSENESNYRFWDSGKIINFYNYQMKKILSYLINMFKSFNVYYQFSTDEIVNYLSLHLYTLFDTFKITKKHLHRFESFDHFECFIKDNLEASSDKYNRLIVFYKNILNDCKCKDISDLCEKDRIYLCNKIIFQLINAKLNLNKVNYIDSKLNVKILYSPTTLEKLLYIPIKTLDKYFYVYTKEISFEMNDLIEPIENQNKSIKDATNIVVNKNETHPEMVKVSLKKYLNKRIKKLQKFNNEEIKGDYNL